MEEFDLSQLTDAEVMSMYNEVIESGTQALIAKGCSSGFTSVGGNKCCKTCYGQYAYCYNGVYYDDCYWY